TIMTKRSISTFIYLLLITFSYAQIPYFNYKLKHTAVVAKPAIAKNALAKGGSLVPDSSHFYSHNQQFNFSATRIYSYDGNNDADTVLEKDANGNDFRRTINSFDAKSRVVESIREIIDTGTGKFVPVNKSIIKYQDDIMVYNGFY